MIRIAIRSLRRTPAFSIPAILTLAVGIGLSTAVYTVANALLLRRLPVRDQDRLVVLWGETRNHRFDHYPVTLASGREFSRRTRSLQHVAFYTYEGASPTAIQEGPELSLMRRSRISGDFFGVLGARPILGRSLGLEDDVVGAAPVVVLAHGAWQRVFRGRLDIVGRQIVSHENGVAYTIVGVMPPGLEFPPGVDFWAPVMPSAASLGAGDTDPIGVDVIGRLAPGATAANARDELSEFFRRPEASVWSRDLVGVVHAFPQLVLGDARPAVIAFTAAVGLLLLITCINVANLLLVRGLARVREIAVRSALGASRGRVMAQLLIENAILAITGGALGVGLAAALVRSFVAFAPGGVPRLEEVRLNGGALAAAMGITGLAMLLFGLAPAMMTSRVELQAVLRSDARQSAGRRSRRAAEVLVAGQVALALLVLSAAGLIARSLIKLERADLSLQPSGLLIGELALRFDQYNDVAKQLALLEKLVPELRAIPGVRAVSPVVAAPFTTGWSGRPGAEGQSPEQAARNPVLNMELVGPEYFAALGIPLLRGRVFTDQDRAGGPPVVMLSKSAARYYWPGGDAIGKRLAMGGELKQMLTVVGVVPDTRYRDLRDARPSIYFPLRQTFFPFAPTVLAIRTSNTPEDLVPAIRRAVAASASGVALGNVAPFDIFLDQPLAQPRLNALLLVVFAGAAVALAAIGLFGIMASMVRQRTRELGVRMALGASAGDVRRMVLRRGLTIAATGMAAGLLGAFAANRLLRAMLYEVSPTDGVTLALVAALLFAVAMVATFIPARSSTRIDPMIALRAEG
jgi:putative ABC transport system permease protein